MFIKTVEDILQPTLVLTIVKINPKIYKSKHGKQTPYASQTHFYHSKALPNYGALFVLYGAPLFFTTFFLNTNLKWIVGFIFYSLTVHIFISNSLYARIHCTWDNQPLVGSFCIFIISTFMGDVSLLFFTWTLYFLFLGPLQYSLFYFFPSHEPGNFSRPYDYCRTHT